MYRVQSVFLFPHKLFESLGFPFWREDFPSEPSTKGLSDVLLVGDGVSVIRLSAIVPSTLKTTDLCVKSRCVHCD